MAKATISNQQKYDFMQRHKDLTVKCFTQFKNQYDHELFLLARRELGYSTKTTKPDILASLKTWR